MLNQSIPGDYKASEQDAARATVLHTSNPFPGLRPFTTDECHLFFGREGQVDEILVKLSDNRFIAVMGYSGSGKSSLAYCGLVPVLYGGFVTRTGPQWTIITVRPGTSPIANLAQSVVDHLFEIRRAEDDGKEIHKAVICSMLRSGPNGLLEVTRYLQRETGENVLFLIDQFEEIFHYRDDKELREAEGESQQYVNLLMAAVEQQELPIYVAITMRSDFISNCSVFFGLAQLINKSNYLISQMTREQKKMVIEGPVAVAGGRISQRLVRRLLSDMGNDQDQLPILQHALMRTWDYWQKNREPGEPLDLRHYNAIGQISMALSQHANETYDELTAVEKGIAEVLFKSITEKNHDSKGMRRPCRLALIAEQAEASELDVIRVIDHFRSSGRSFLMPAANVPLTGDSLIELSHESLMRIWNRLDAWVEEEFESAQMYKRLSEAAAMYQIGKTGLWRPPDLQLALNWQKKQRPARAWAQRYDEAFERAIVFLDTSRITYEAELRNQEMMQRRVLRRTRATAVILGIAAVIAILFMVFAYIQMLKADEQTRLALEQEKEARIQKNIALDQKNQADSLRVLAENSRQLLEVTNIELEKTLRQASGIRKTAFLSSSGAETQAPLVNVGVKGNVNKTSNTAKRLYMLSKARALASISIQEYDENLAGLLAIQAYHFHRRYAGEKNDPHVYSGLHYALTKLSGAAYTAVSINGSLSNKVNSIVASKKDSIFYVAVADGRILQGSYKNLQGLATRYTTTSGNNALALSKDGNWLVAGSDSAFIQICNLKDPNRKPEIISGFRGRTNDLKFLPHDTGIVTASGDVAGKKFGLSLADHHSGEVHELLILSEEARTISINPDGNSVAAGTQSGKVLLINLTTKTITLISEEASQIRSVSFSPDGNIVAYGIDDPEHKRGGVNMVNLKTGERRQLPGHHAGVVDVEFSPNGEFLASAGSDHRLRLWVLKGTSDSPVVMESNGFIYDIAFSRESQYLIVTTRESEIKVWCTDINFLAKQVCSRLRRALTLNEWSKYVGDDVEYESACAGLTGY